MTKQNKVQLLLQSIFFLISTFCFSQKNLNFSQIAFEYYKDSIWNKNQKIYIQKKLEKSDVMLIDSVCFKNFKTNKRLKIIKKYNFLNDLNEDNIFFTNEYIGHPILNVSIPFSNNKNQYFVIINYKYLNSSGYFYLFEIDKKGVITNKCKQEYIE